MLPPFRINHTCTCGAYHFPHRLSSGKCDGTEWAGDYFLTDRMWCEYCNCNNNNECEVAIGIESIYECDAIINI